MIRTIRASQAASSAIAQATQTVISVVDVGSINPELPDDRHVRPGTGNLHFQPAMTFDEFQQAWDVGVSEVEQAATASILATGEMGIGNTTAAACLAVLLAGVPIEIAVGPGAGADSAMQARKRQVVTEALERVRSAGGSLREQIAQVCGLEIAAMAGFMAASARRKIACVLDGYIATAAALIAETLQPGTRDYLIAAHCSAEPGHRHLLQHLHREPFLDWNLRLGEGTGALLLMPMLDAAAALVRYTATLDSVLPS